MISPDSEDSNQHLHNYDGDDDDEDDNGKNEDKDVEHQLKYVQAAGREGLTGKQPAEEIFYFIWSIFHCNPSNVSI